MTTLLASVAARERSTAIRRVRRVPLRSVASPASDRSREALPIYLEDMSAIPLLGPERERELFSRLERITEELRLLQRRSARPPLDPMADLPEGTLEKAELALGSLEREARDPDAKLRGRLRRYRREIDATKSDLVLANLRLVVHLAKRYAGHGVALLDLIQEGNIGLMKAIEKFDHGRGNKLSTYAHWWIKQAIVRSIADKSRLIRLPVHLHERRRKVHQVGGQLSQRLGRPPEPAEIARQLHVTLDAVEQVLGTIPEPVALDDAGHGDNGPALLGTIEDPASASPWLQLARRDLSAKVDEILKSLPPREERVLRLRFGIGHSEPRTLDEIGELIQVSRERVRQIQSAALRRLRESRAFDEFRSYPGA